MTDTGPLQPVAAAVAGVSGEAVAVRCVAPPFKGVQRCNGNAPTPPPAPPAKERKSADGNWGPWESDIADHERVARLRALRALALLYTGKASDVVRHLHAAETDADAGPRAYAALRALPTLKFRHIVANYGALITPPR